MIENGGYSISSEIGRNYELSIKRYLLARFDQLTETLVINGEVGPLETHKEDIKNFALALVKAVPVYFVEQVAPSAHSYSSLRGAGYSEMSLTLAGRSIFNKGSLDSIRLNHEFRAGANALDAVVDEVDGITNRKILKHLPIAEGFRKSKNHFFENLKRQAKCSAKENLSSVGNSARRYQMHQDLYLDLAKMKKDGIESTSYLKNIPESGKGFPFAREETALLIVLGMDGETLLVDSLPSVNPGVSFDSRVRDAAFWGAIVGTLGDQWADVLQDFCSGSMNMFFSVLDRFPKQKDAALGELASLKKKGLELLSRPTIQNKVRFLRLQMETHQLLRGKAPEAVDKYGQLVASAFSQIPNRFRGVLIPIRFAAWDWVLLYQLSDFLLHLDRYEEEAKVYSKSQVKGFIEA